MLDNIDGLPVDRLLAPLVIFGAMGLSAGMIVAMRPLLVRYAMARPNARSSHRQPTPQGGGIAVLVATIGTASLAALAAGDLRANAETELFRVIAATALLAAVGAIDDVRVLGAATRLLLHTLAVAAVIAALPPELRIVEDLPWWAERVLLVLGGVWFINLVNFMDGIDWMTVAEVLPVAGGVVLIGMFGALPAHAILVALALIGATLGFAPFNRPVARLFLGDVGSLPIGLLLGWLLLLLAGAGHLAAALLLPLYYLADATITLLRRIGNGEPVWQAHRTHFYQRATDQGFTVPEIIRRVFLVNLALVGLAAITVAFPGFAISCAALIVGGALVGWLLMRLAHGPRHAASPRKSGTASRRTR
jgi:UDP-N-acetylmuramyl pentapeptide phosphotransferase/UDP-N-acetylglucosamine-1-phosphate transferase